MTTELATQEAPQQVVIQRGEHLPVMTMDQAHERRGAVVQFIQSIMDKDQDYGVIPGTNKPTLLKPGAEKLANFFGLEPSIIPISEERDWTGANHGGEAFFYFEYRYELRKGGHVVGVGVGSCNSWESKYRWRKSERECPACGTAAIIKGKEEYGGGWVCFKRKDGCGAKFKDGDPAIESQQVGRIPNPDIFDQVNTFQKMAKKRAQIDATLNATSASEFYTQDLEDMGPGHREPPPPPAVDPAIAAKLGAMTNFDEAVKVIQAHKYEIEAATGSTIAYYEILAKRKMEHANDLKGKPRSTIAGLVKELHEYVAKVTAEPPATPFDAGDDDVPPIIKDAMKAEVGEDL